MNARIRGPATFVCLILAALVASAWIKGLWALTYTPLPAGENLLLVCSGPSFMILYVPKGQAAWYEDGVKIKTASGKVYGVPARQADARVFPFEFNAQWIPSREAYVVDFPAWAPLILFVGLPAWWRYRAWRRPAASEPAPAASATPEPTGTRDDRT